MSSVGFVDGRNQRCPPCHCVCPVREDVRVSPIRGNQRRLATDNLRQWHMLRLYSNHVRGLSSVTHNQTVQRALAVEGVPVEANNV